MICKTSDNLCVTIQSRDNLSLKQTSNGTEHGITTQEPERKPRLLVFSSLLRNEMKTRRNERNRKSRRRSKTDNKDGQGHRRAHSSMHQFIIIIIIIVVVVLSYINEIPDDDLSIFRSTQYKGVRIVPNNSAV